MKAPSDSTLNKLWRRAVLHKWQADPFTGCRDPDRLQCHHFIRRKHYVTRWDWRNGIPLTAESHLYAHTGAGGRAIADVMWKAGFLSLLEERERWMKKDYLIERGLSDAEFRLMMKRKLEKALSESPMLIGHILIDYSQTHTAGRDSVFTV